MNNIQLDSDLLPVYTDVMAATRPEDVFGHNQTYDTVKSRFKELVAVLDPERYTRIIDANAAADARRELTKFYRQVSGSGTQPVLETLHVAGSSYVVQEHIATGDHSVVYRATRSTQDGPSEVVLKIAHDKHHAQKLRHEAQLLRFFHTAHDKHPIVGMRKTLPTLVDSFAVEEKEVLVLPYYEGYWSVADILRHFNHQIPVGHAAWIARRILALPITAAIAGVGLGESILEHVLVHPITHEPMYIGWADSEPDKRWDGYLALVDAKETMVAVQSLFADADGNPNPDVPVEITEYLEEHSSMFSDMPTVLTEFTELVYATLGKKYRPLKL